MEPAFLTHSPPKAAPGQLHPYWSLASWGDHLALRALGHATRGVGYRGKALGWLGQGASETWGCCGESVTVLGDPLAGLLLKHGHSLRVSPRRKSI